MRKLTKRSTAVIAASVIAVSGGGAAWAIASGWFQGSGSASASSSTIQPVTATITIDPTTTRLYPGKVAAINALVTNPNDYNVQINSVTVADVTATKAGVLNSACTEDDADLTVTGDLTSAQVVAGAADASVAANITMGPDASSACAGSVLSATLTMTGQIAS